MVAKKSDRPGVTVYLTPDEYSKVQNLAFKAETSMSQIGQIALLRLLADDLDGTVDLAPKFNGLTAGRA